VTQVLLSMGMAVVFLLVGGSSVSAQGLFGSSRFSLFEGSGRQGVQALDLRFRRFDDFGLNRGQSLFGSFGRGNRNVRLERRVRSVRMNQFGNNRRFDQFGRNSRNVRFDQFGGRGRSSGFGLLGMGRTGRRLR